MYLHFFCIPLSPILHIFLLFTSLLSCILRSSLLSPLLLSFSFSLFFVRSLSISLSHSTLLDILCFLLLFRSDSPAIILSSSCFLLLLHFRLCSFLPPSFSPYSSLCLSYQTSSQNFVREKSPNRIFGSRTNFFLHYNECFRKIKQ